MLTELIEKILMLLSISTIRYFIMAGIAFALCYKLFARKLYKAKIQLGHAARSNFKRDIWYSMQTTIIHAIIGCLVLFTPLKDYTKVYEAVTDYPLWWFCISLPVCLIIHDTYFYWMHRLLHVKVIFPRVHLLHHRSTNPSPWTSYSFHFFEAWTEGAVLILIVFLIPIHPIALELFVVVAFAINVYGHLGYEIAPKWFRRTWLFEIFNTSVHHNLHHLKFKGNYGLYFRIWDRLLNTEHPDYVKEYDKIQNRRI
ncbi:sterol desaturase family protein [Pedobacter nyackensis]|uniref:C-5 sterol desaturase n=1 Tax=Pedobacter nyackensis TaxID=475255 RepID=A0A1W2ABD1_9SPHI|nr:sterol desaturase family protein [Pedobacter nyackensis]SMC57987.1 C-5 sterol desaturase [Pedobacter nyackensis]